MGTVYQKHVHPWTTVWERSPCRPQCKCVRGGCFGGKSSFSPFSAMACHSHKIQAPPGRLKKKQINHLFFMPVCWEALLGWLNTGLEVTAGVTLSVCWCVHMCWGVCPLLTLLQSSLALCSADPCRLHGSLQDLFPQPVPTHPCLFFLLWHRVPIQLWGLWTQSLCPKPPGWHAPPTWWVVGTLGAWEARQTGSLLLPELVKHCPRPVR